MRTSFKEPRGNSSKSIPSGEDKHSISMHVHEIDVFSACVIKFVKITISYTNTLSPKTKFHVHFNFAFPAFPDAT